MSLTSYDILVAARAAGMSGDLAEADRLLDHAIERDPGSAAAWGMRALVAIERHDLHRAAADAGQAETLAPDDPQYVNLAISIALRRHRYGEAIGRCERAIVQAPGNQRARCDLLIAARAAGDRRYDHLLDLDRLVSNETLIIGLGRDGAGSLHDVVADAVVAGLRDGGEQPGTLVGGRRLPDAFALPDQASQPLREMIAAAVCRYGRAIGATPPQHRLVGWANLMRAGDFERPHIHEAAWISGVYYPRLPDCLDEDAGAIRFGDHHYPDVPPLPRRTVRPVTGTLLLFPSYLPHASLPFDAPGDRISIAFDILPTE